MIGEGHTPNSTVNPAHIAIPVAIDSGTALAFRFFGTGVSETSRVATAPPDCESVLSVHPFRLAQQVDPQTSTDPSPIAARCPGLETM